MPLEYMRQEPPDGKEYYQCSVCHEEKHIDNLVIKDRFREIALCANCDPGKLCCTKCNEDVVNDVALWLACECTSREIGNDEPFPTTWVGLTPHEMDATEEDCDNCSTWVKCIACPGSGLRNP